MHAPLAMMAWALKDALEQAFGFLGEYFALGEDEGGSLMVNTDFGVSMRDAADLTALQGALAANAITKATFLAELKRRGVLADAIDVEDEVARLETEAPDLTGEQMPLGGYEPAPKEGATRTFVTKHDSKGRIAEFVKVPIAIRQIEEV
jgi:hypothetical protein